jgi:hypothetical protein
VCAELGVLDERWLRGSLAGEDRLRHDQLLLGNGDGDLVDDGEVREHRCERLIDPQWGQPGVPLGDLADEVAHADDVDRSDVRVHPALTGASDDRVALARRESDLREGRLRAVVEVGETGDVVGDVLLSTVDSTAWTETSRQAFASTTITSTWACLLPGHRWSARRW